MNDLGWSIEKNELVESDADPDLLKKFQENVLNPAINSALIEPWNIVASVTNSVSERIAGTRVLPHKHELDTAHSNFLSTSWFVQSVSGGLALLVPYSLSGKAAGSILEHSAARFNVSHQANQILKSEASAQILGAALYDGLRETKQGETHLGNAAGGVAAFSVFAIGNALSKDLPLSRMLAVRTLSGALGGSAQHAASAYISGQGFPGIEELSRATVNGIVMSVLLPESQRALKALAKTNNGRTGLSVPLDRLEEKYKVKTPAKVEGKSHLSAHLEAAPETYDFFIKVEGTDRVLEERSRDEGKREVSASSSVQISSNFPLAAQA